MRCHHYCNNPLACPECVRRFWKWAEQHTRGRAPKGGASSTSFYEAASKFPPKRRDLAESVGLEPNTSRCDLVSNQSRPA